MRAELTASWQCWDNTDDAKASSPPRAFWVPWLDGKGELMATANRLCAYEKPALTLRCWQPPERGQPGVEMPETDEWLNPHHAPFADISRPDWAAEAYLGGTFTCLRNVGGNTWCFGDDSVGQLASASVKRSADAYGLPFISLWPGLNMAVGSFHGCAVAEPRAIREQGRISCWGRGDAGQLAVPAPDVCTYRGLPVACATKPQTGPMIASEVMIMIAGDMFNCISDPSGVRCWGGSRDGFFGKAGSCPASLRKAWPTLGASVPAPRARCSQVAVAIPGAKDFDQDMSAGPRGLCFVSEGKLRCLGGVPTPSEAFGYAVVSPGQDASACSVGGAGVRCWGEAYSSPSSLSKPVTIELEPAVPVSDVAVVGGGAKKWDAGCLVNRGCSTVPVAVPPCQPGLEIVDYGVFVANAASLVGKTVHVRGPLGIGPFSSTAIGCGPGNECCNGVGGPVRLGDSDASLDLGDLACRGDSSQLCCNAPAYGQTVVATGEVAPSHGWSRKGPSFALVQATLCAEATGRASLGTAPLDATP